MRAGANEFTKDPNWDPGDGGKSGRVSGPLGDGVDTPRFFAVNTEAIQRLARTGDGFLRLELAPTAPAQETWPFAAEGAVLMLPLPAAIDPAVDFTLRANLDAVASVKGAAALVRVYLGRAVDGAPAVADAMVAWTRTARAGPPVREYVMPLGLDVGWAPLADATSDGVASRRYRLRVADLRGEVYATKDSTSPLALCARRADPRRAWGATERVLVVAVCATAAVRGLWLEFGGGLRVAGRRTAVG
jgi:hypothetical protein